MLKKHEIFNDNSNFYEDIFDSNHKFDINYGLFKMHPEISSETVIEMIALAKVDNDFCEEEKEFIFEVADKMNLDLDYINELIDLDLN